MAGSGVEIGKDVLILYNDPSPHSIRSLGYSSKQSQASVWIIPGYYYPQRN